ncbi:MAG: hypothetical protein M3Q81_04125 [bacterium]|nr:hypothetical protein [bacterium]
MKRTLQNTTNKLAQSPKAMILAWLFFLTSPLITVLRYYLSVKDVQLDSSYKNILITGLSTLRYLIIFYCLAILFLWIRQYRTREMDAKHRTVLVFMGLTGTLFFIFNTLLLFAEQLKYPNFIYSQTGLPSSLVYMLNQVTLLILIMIFLLLFDKSKTLFRIITFKFLKGSTSKIATVGVFLSFFIVVVNSFQPLINSISHYKTSKITYSQKIGEDFKYIEALQNYTESDASVIHPPQSGVWPFIGNQPMIRYFLFPRLLISGELLEMNELVPVNTAYFFVVNDTPTQHWPLIDMTQKSIIFDTMNSITYQDLELIGTHRGVNVYKVVFYEVR